MSTSVIINGDEIIEEVERALKHLHVDANTRVTLEIKEGSITVTPVRTVDETRAEDLKKAMDKANSRYAETFRALAK